VPAQLRREDMAKSQGRCLRLSVRTTMFSYGTAYRRAYGTTYRMSLRYCLPKYYLPQYCLPQGYGTIHCMSLRYCLPQGYVPTVLSTAGPPVRYYLPHMSLRYYLPQGLRYYIPQSLGVIQLRVILEILLKFAVWGADARTELNILLKIVLCSGFHCPNILNHIRFHKR